MAFIKDADEDDSVIYSFRVKLEVGNLYRYKSLKSFGFAGRNIYSEGDHALYPLNRLGQLKIDDLFVYLGRTNFLMTNPPSSRATTIEIKVMTTGGIVGSLLVYPSEIYDVY